LVNRGFIDIRVATPPAPPAGAVTVVGRLRPTQTRGSIGPRDPTTGHLDALVRLDVARLGQQLAQPVLPGYVELLAQQPGLGSTDPALIPLPDNDNGPHLSYMVQWIIFTICAAVGWGIVVRRTAKQNVKAAASSELLSDEGGAHDAGLVRQGGRLDGSA
jgi:surfeit locus 1 family protein